MPTTLSYFLSVAFFCVSGAFFFISQLDYITSLKIASQFSLNNDASHIFTQKLYGDIISKSKFSGALFLFLSLLVFVMRNKIKQISFSKDYKSFVKDMKKKLQEFTSSLSPLHYISFSITLMLATYVRFLYINDPLTGDEGVIYYAFVKKPFYITMSLYTNVGNHIFQTLLSKISVFVLGDSIFAIRLPILICSLALIFSSGVIFGKKYGPWTGVLTASFIGSSYAILEYSILSRGYIVQALLLVWCLGLLFYLQKKNNNFAWIVFSVLLALSFFTLPTTLYVYGGIGLWHLTYLLRNSSSDRNTQIYSFIGANLFAALITLFLYYPAWFLTSFTHLKAMSSSSKSSLNDFLIISDLFQSWFATLPAYYIFIPFIVLGVFYNSLLIFSLLWLVFLSFLINLPGFSGSFFRIWLPFSLFTYMTISLGVSKFFNKVFPSYKNKVLWAISLFISISPTYVEYTNKTFLNRSYDVSPYVRPSAKWVKENISSIDLIYGHTGFPLKFELEQLGIQTNIAWIKDDTEMSHPIYVPSDKTLQSMLKGEQSLNVAILSPADSLENISWWKKSSTLPRATIGTSKIHLVKVRASQLKTASPHINKREVY